MRQILVDEEVWGFLQSKAEPFVDKEPNHVLRRLFGLNGASGIKKDRTPQPNTSSRVKTQKKEKTNVIQLIKSDLIKQGQTLYLMDYRGQLHRNFFATVAGRHLNYKERRVSMSELAKDLLKQLGHQSESVRGPAHWATEDGVTIKDLWEKYLDA